MANQSLNQRPAKTTAMGSTDLVPVHVAGAGIQKVARDDIPTVLGVAAAATTARQVATLAALKTTTASGSGEVVYLKGYAATGDGGEGHWQWNSTLHHQQVATIAVNAGGSGYAVGTVIRLNTGTNVNSMHALAQVSSVSSGAVTGLTLLSGGRYSSNPTTTGGATATKFGEAGSGLTVNLTMANYNDDGAVVNPTGSSSAGRWVRVFSGAVNVKWFGATGSNTGDDFAAIQTAFYTVSGGGAVYLPSGTYRCQSTLTFPGASFMLFGDGDASRISGTPSGPALQDAPVISAPHTQQCTVKDLCFSGSPTVGLAIRGAAICSFFDNLYFRGTPTDSHLLLERGWGIEFGMITCLGVPGNYHIKIDSTGNGVNAVHFRYIYTSGAATAALYITKSGQNVDVVNTQIDHATLQAGSSGTGLFAKDCRGLNISSLYCEGNAIAVRLGDNAGARAEDIQIGNIRLQIPSTAVGLNLEYVDRVSLGRINVSDISSAWTTATDISFVASDNSINSTSTDLSAIAGIVVGGFIRAVNSANNDGTFRVQSITTSKIVVHANIVDESAGASISLHNSILPRMVRLGQCNAVTLSGNRASDQLVSYMSISENRKGLTIFNGGHTAKPSWPSTPQHYQIIMKTDENNKRHLKAFMGSAGWQYKAWTPPNDY